MMIVMQRQLTDKNIKRTTSIVTRKWPPIYRNNIESPYAIFKQLKYTSTSCYVHYRLCPHANIKPSLRKNVGL